VGLRDYLKLISSAFMEGIIMNGMPYSLSPILHYREETADG
jgi:hypothetical protein